MVPTHPIVLSYTKCSDATLFLMSEFTVFVRNEESVQGKPAAKDVFAFHPHMTFFYSNLLMYKMTSEAKRMPQSL